MTADRPGGYSLAPGAEWTDRAATWPVALVSRGTRPGHHRGEENQIHLCCTRCRDLPSVFCLAVGLEAYTVMWADVLAGILAHIRRSHET